MWLDAGAWGMGEIGDVTPVMCGGTYVPCLLSRRAGRVTQLDG